MKIPVRFSTSLLAAAVLCFGVTGCGRKADTTSDASPGGKRKVVLGFIGKSLSNDVFQAAEAGARDAARDLGTKYGVDVALEVRTPNDEDATKQAEAIEALSRRGAEGIAVSCSESGTVTASIDQAVDKGAAVVCFDSDAPNSKRFAYYGTDDHTCGLRVIDELAKAMGEKGDIAILAGSQSAPNLQARVAGVKEGLAKYPNMKLVDTFYHVETPEKAAEAVSTAQNANPNINGWAMVGGWPLFTTDALKWAPGTVKVISVDALPAQLNYLKDGHVQMLLAQDCYGWGAKSVELLLNKIVNKQAPPTTRVVDPLTAVTSANADDYGKNWEKWLGKK